jgi:hypothetical protein
VNIDLRFRASQLRASKIALHDSALFEITGDDLHKLDPTTLKRLQTWTVAARQLRFVQDGSLVVFAPVPGSVKSAVYRIDTHGDIETFEGPMMTDGAGNVVVRGRAANEIYVSEGDHLVHLKLDGMQAEELPRLPHPSPNDTSREQLFGRGDGSVVGPAHAGGIALVSPAGLVSSFPTPERFVMHIVPGTQDRVWYSYAVRPATESAHYLALAEVHTPMTELAKLDVSPGRIVHVGSGGGAAAALVVDREGGWVVVVVDERAGVRWRAQVPAPVADVSLTAGFVAIDERRVVLAGPDRVHLSWDTGTGKLVGQTS